LRTKPGGPQAIWNGSASSDRRVCPEAPSHDAGIHVIRITILDDLIAEVDRVAGKRMRSRFVEDAIREKLTRQSASAALAQAAGLLSIADYPEWVSPERVSAWVKAERRNDDTRLVRKLWAGNG